MWELLYKGCLPVLAAVCTALKVADVLYFDNPIGRVKIQTRRKNTGLEIKRKRKFLKSHTILQKILI